MNYTNCSCEKCRKMFQEKDDIVVCPECGTPHHRSCYQDLAQCINIEKHENGFVWQPPQKTGPSVPLSQQKNGTDEFILCSRCGSLNPKDVDKCELCGTPLAKSGARMPNLVAKEADNPEFTQYIREQYNIRPNEKVIGILTAKEIASYVGPNSLSFLYKFRNMLSHKSALSVNIPAFLFNFIYLFYRKMHKWGLIFMGISIVSSIPFFMAFVPYFKDMAASGSLSFAEIMTINTLSPYYDKLIATANISRYISLITNVLCGLFFNGFYLKKVTKDVNDLRKNPSITIGTEKYYSALSKKGGTSFLSCIVAIAFIFLITTIGMNIIM